MEKFTIFLIIIYCSEIWSFSCYSCSGSECESSKETINCNSNKKECYSMRYSRDYQEKGCLNEDFSTNICDNLNRRPRLNVTFNGYCFRCKSENCNICKNKDICTLEELYESYKTYYDIGSDKPNKGMSCYECSGAGDYCEYEFGTSQVVTCYEGECFVMQNETHFMQGCIRENMIRDFPVFCDQIHQNGKGFCKTCNDIQNCNQRFKLDPNYDPKKFNLQYTKNTTDDDKLKCYNCSKIACETQHFAIEVCEASVHNCYVMYRNNIPYKMGCNTKRLTLESCRNVHKHQYCTTCEENYCNSSISITTNFKMIILFLFVFSLLNI